MDRVVDGSVGGWLGGWMDGWIQTVFQLRRTDEKGDNVRLCALVSSGLSIRTASLAGQGLTH